MVRIAQQALRIAAVMGVEPNPDTRGGEKAVPIDRVRNPQRVHDFLG
jgi:hypothetical protein